MAGVLDEIHEEAQTKQASGGSVLDEIHAEATKKDEGGKLPSDVPEGYQPPRQSFLERRAEEARNVVPGLWNIVRHPYLTGKATLDAMQAEAAKARQAPTFSEQFGHALASAIPVVGPAAAQAGEELGKGDFLEGAYQTGMLVGPSVSKLLPARAGKFGPLVKTVTNPVQERALSELGQATSAAGASRTPIPMSAGQRSGQLGLQRLERVTLPNVPGSGSRAHLAQAGTEEALAKRGGEITSSVSPVRTDVVGAAKPILEVRLPARINRLKGRADALYDSVRKDAAANQKAIQTGTKTSPILGPSGQPITTPVMTVFETPVALDPIRTGLRSIYEELERSLPDAKRANSPAWKSLQELMTSDKTHMNALDFDRTLSALKAITRDGSSTVLSNRAQGLAKQMIQSGEAEFQKAMQGAGLDTLAKLKKARDAVRAYHQTADLLSELPSEPGKLYSHLTQGGDKSLNLLEDLNRVAPNELRVVGRTYLEELMSRATAKGGFDRVAGIGRDWGKLGPRTKELMFGKDLTQELDRFMVGGEGLTRPLNPSGTAHSAVASLGTVGLAYETAKHLLQGQFLKAAGTAVAAPAVANVAARLLFSPSGRDFLLKARSVPIQGPARAAALSGLAGMLINENRQEQEQQDKFTAPSLPMPTQPRQ
jgi:hypothetical protein